MLCIITMQYDTALKNSDIDLDLEKHVDYIEQI